MTTAIHWQRVHVSWHICDICLECKSNGLDNQAMYMLFLHPTYPEGSFTLSETSKEPQSNHLKSCYTLLTELHALD
jgi:hypothetical protein